MLIRTALLFALLAVSTTILTGAWFGTAPPPPPSVPFGFSPQDVKLDKSLAGMDAQTVLDLAIKRLDADWLRAKLRQSSNQFVAEGFVQCGPNQCMRLEMEVQCKSSRGKWTLVSDGVVLAKVRNMPDAPDSIHVETLPSSPAERLAVLANQGGGGPLALLRSARSQLKDASLQTGILGQHAVIQIRGNAKSEPMSIYLDARTLLPIRVETSNLQIEFAEFELGRELPAAECARVFSYHPTGNEQVTQK
jgi:hypothetical protein